MLAAQTEVPTILLIEDDRAIRELLEECLGGEGYAVTTATDGAAARDALAEQRPHAERWAQLEAIRRAAHGAPTIICTAHRANTYADYAARGFSALLTKPFDLEALLAVIVHTLTCAAPAGRGARQ